MPILNRMTLSGRTATSAPVTFPGTALGAEIPLLAGWAAIGLGAALDNGSYSVLAVVLVTAGTAALVLTAMRRWAPTPQWSRPVTLVAGLAVLIGFHDAAGIYGSGAALTVSRALTTSATVAVAVWLVLGLPRQQLVTYGAIAVMTAAGAAMVVSSPKPAIDVWYMLQAAGQSLSHGHNIYTSHWSSGVVWEQSNGFAYLPGAAVLLWPFHALFGDVRAGLLVAMAATAFMLTRLRPHSPAVLLGAMVLLYPKATFGLEQAWVDPLVLVTVCAAAYAVVRGRHGWAVVAFAACLACKQQAWLMLPLAMFWKEFGWRRAALSAAGAVAFMAPWVISAPHAFYTGVIAYNLDLPARLDSLSWFRTAVGLGWTPGLAVMALATVGAMVLMVWRLPRDTYGFLLGSVVVMAVFNLTSKQSFFNEWALAAGLALVALAFGPVPTTLARRPALQEAVVRSQTVTPLKVVAVKWLSTHWVI